MLISARELKYFLCLSCLVPFFLFLFLLFLFCCILCIVLLFFIFIFLILFFLLLIYLIILVSPSKFSTWCFHSIGQLILFRKCIGMHCLNRLLNYWEWLVVWQEEPHHNQLSTIPLWFPTLFCSQATDRQSQWGSCTVLQHTSDVMSPLHNTGSSCTPETTIHFFSFLIIH